MANKKMINSPNPHFFVADPEPVMMLVKQLAPSKLFYE
jgi:hypothetical protein